jgi:hypothetical protein
MSLRNLAGKEKAKLSKAKTAEDPKPKKSKSSASLSAFLTRSKSSKDLKSEAQTEPKDKENQTPPNSAVGSAPPIWAQYASPSQCEVTSTTKIPLNDRRNVHEELAFYTPQDYSPSKGRNFYDEQPTLSRKTKKKAPPRSAVYPSSNTNTSFISSLSLLRKSSTSSRKSTKRGQPGAETRSKEETSTKGQTQRIPPTQSVPSTDRNVSDVSSAGGLTMVKQTSRVKAAVAAWNGKAKDESPGSYEASIEAAFENMLVGQP